MSKNDDIFECPARAIVNPINTIGVMGAGLAKAFRIKYPRMYRFYRRRCKRGIVQLGKMDIHDGEDGRLIINFPTIDDPYEGQYDIQNIINGLTHLKKSLEGRCLMSVGIPALGCGIGTLTWKEVYAAICDEFSTSPITVFVYPPR